MVFPQWLERWDIISFAFLTLMLCYYWLSLIMAKKMKMPCLPPGPRSFPLIGNLLFLCPNLHQRFAKYAETYGPIMKIKLGTKLWIIISSPTLAKEVYKDNDIIFSNHDQPIASKVISYGGSNLVRTPYGPTWRMLRKVFLHQLLNTKNLDAFSILGKREVNRMVHELHSKKGTPVNIAEHAFTTFLNILTSMLWGGTLELGTEFRQAVTDIAQLLGRPNISDFLPVLAWFDLQGIERGIKKRVLLLDKMIDDIIEERVKLDGGDGSSEGGKECKKDFLSILLKIRESGDSTTPLTTTNLKALMMDLIVGGTSGTTTTVEWVMVELMHNPEITKKVQEELEAVVGLGRMVDESHLHKLHYLRAVIKETLRLHTVLPLLVPRVPSQPCIVGGYLIPLGARVVTNVWAIHMNPKIWDDPSELRPTRFLSSSSSRDFSYFPFGSGRRRCAGFPLVERMLPLVVANLLHAFQWRVPQELELDPYEKSGVKLTKVRPTLAIPTPSFSIADLYG